MHGKKSKSSTSYYQRVFFNQPIVWMIILYCFAQLLSGAGEANLSLSDNIKNLYKGFNKYSTHHMNKCHRATSQANKAERLWRIALQERICNSF